MSYHYIPQYNERAFNRIAVEADPVLIERRRMEVCRRQQEVYREIVNLRSKPYRTIPESVKLNELEAERERLKRCGGVRGTDDEKIY